MADPTDLLLVVAALAEQGLNSSGERLVAPNGTLWLSRPMLDLCGLYGIRMEAERRLRRTRRHRRSYQSGYDWQCAMEDSEALLMALDQVCESREPELLAKAS
jgi:hypothetical protein